LLDTKTSYPATAPSAGSQANVAWVWPMISISAFADATTQNQAVESAHQRRTRPLVPNILSVEIKVSPAGDLPGNIWVFRQAGRFACDTDHSNPNVFRNSIGEPRAEHQTRSISLARAIYSGAACCSCGRLRREGVVWSGDRGRHLDFQGYGPPGCQSPEGRGLVTGAALTPRSYRYFECRA
jgi:hypothetical protein